MSAPYTIPSPNITQSKKNNQTNSSLPSPAELGSAPPQIFLAGGYLLTHYVYRTNIWSILGWRLGGSTEPMGHVAGMRRKVEDVGGERPVKGLRKLSLPAILNARYYGRYYCIIA